MILQCHPEPVSGHVFVYLENQSGVAVKPKQMTTRHKSAISATRLGLVQQFEVYDRYRHLPRSRGCVYGVEKSYVRLCSSSHFNSSSEHQISRRPSKFPMAPSTTYVYLALFLFNADTLISIASRVLRSVTFMEHSA